MDSSPSPLLTGHSVQGARHVQMNTPCQDAVLVHQEKDLMILCAADGHGDSKHARSDEGAKIAVRIAGKILRQAFLDLKEDQRNHKELEQSIREHLPRRISWEWNRTVQQQKEGTWSREVILYGCTILAAAISHDLCIFLQLGDGDMLFVNQDGHPEFIFPPQEDMYGTVTRSLCQPNVAQHTQICVRSLSQPRLFLMSTDGLRDSLQDNEENYINVGRWLLKKYQQQGFTQLANELPDWMSKISFQGNGDDTTMAFSIWPSPHDPLPLRNQSNTSRVSLHNQTLVGYFGEPDDGYTENPISTTSAKKDIPSIESQRNRYIVIPRHQLKPLRHIRVRKKRRMPSLFRKK